LRADVGKRGLILQVRLSGIHPAVFRPRERQGEYNIVGRFDGRTAVVTGAGNGIGRGIALRLASDGASVGILDHDAVGCERVLNSIMEFGGKGIALPADVSNLAEMNHAIGQLDAAYGAPTVAVHSAGIMPTGTLLETSEMEWDRVHAVNVKGAFLLCKEVIPHMLREKKGSIIFVSSITGVIGMPGLAAYSSTKGALISLARALAIDFAREGIRVNSIAPGTIDSSMLHDFVAAQKDPEETRRKFDDIQPRGSIGTIEEVVNLVAFLASDESSLINGANLPVDGGMSVKGQQPRL
jgi:NAD(P)-dependent dehydrogenase (short-subunit alcohol dehydrogenase family)